MSIVCKNTPRLELTWLSSFWGTGTGTELQLECGAYNIQTLLLAAQEVLVFICIQLHRFGEHLVPGTCEWKAIWQLVGAVSPFGNNLTVFGFQFQHIPCVICAHLVPILWMFCVRATNKLQSFYGLQLHFEVHLFGNHCDAFYTATATRAWQLQREHWIRMPQFISLPPEVPVRCINFRRY